ncbi:xanthine dehydrogenase family protein molybdopterin-binding subunit [Rugosimonospora acidiphila]|uniref:Xanthine dehydrogenase family protein molybdopterin-binding subunit n=1 Tax=Rugosimonospora acidiphila TaxID=556531 RepID=A0ABP9S9A1_9ACTN
MTIPAHAMGEMIDRIDGPDKVRGLARYAFEQPVERPAYLYPVQATIARGRMVGLDCRFASSEPGVLAVLHRYNAVRTRAQDGLGELDILQSDRVAFRNQFVAGVIAETSEIARHAAGLVRVEYQSEPHDVAFSADRDDLWTPSTVLSKFPMEVDKGDVDAGLADAPVRLDRTYTTPRYYHNAMEPHTTVACWADDQFTIYTSSQGVHAARGSIAALFGLDPRQIRVISPNIGGAFGSKAHVNPELILALLAARLVPGRPVKLALTRQQAFFQAGYRPETIQRIAIGAQEDGHIVAMFHACTSPTSQVQEYAEHCTRATPTMYATPNLRTQQRLASLDIPTPTIMRAPGECPGMFALESAMDELAVECGIDPIELRMRNEPETHPGTGLPFSSRNLIACLREGAERFGWDERDPTPRSRNEDGWLVGTGVAASTYHALQVPGSVATIRAEPPGRYTVLIAAADLGTGTWTALTQVAADALGVGVSDVELRIGDTAYPQAVVAGGSAGIASWGTAICEAAGQLRQRLGRGGTIPVEGLEVTAQMPENPYADQYSMHSFGAQFAEVRVNAETGEVRVPRLLGVFAAGRIVNPKTARSQLLGGMTMGMSMALHEDGVLDARFGSVVNQDLATYHISSNADVGAVEVRWLPEDDPYVNPMGTKGIGELGIVGAAAAVANAVYHATGVRIRDLPITLDKLMTW